MPYSDPNFEARRQQLLGGSASPSASVGGGFSSAFDQQRTQVIQNPRQQVPQIQSTQPQVTQNPAQKFIAETKTKAAPLVEKAKTTAKGLFEQGKEFAKAVPGYVKAAVKEPTATAAGAGTKVITSFGGSFAGGIQHGIADIAGIEIPERWDLKKQAKAFEELNRMNLEAYGEDSVKAFETGKFLGQFVPYYFGGALAKATIGAKILAPTAAKFAPKAAKLAPVIAEEIGFSGVGQLEYDKEIDGSRVDRLKTDVIMLGLFKTGGVLAKGLSNGTKKIISTTYNETAGKLKSGERVPIYQLENTINPVKEKIQVDTGKPAPLALADNIVKASDDELELIASKTETQTRIPKAIAEQDLYLQSAEGEVRKIPQELKEDFWRLDNEGLAKGKSWHVTAGLTPEKIQRAGLKIGKDADEKVYDELQAKITPSPTNENIKFVEEVLATGDVEAARQIYKDLPKEGYMPSFEEIKRGFDQVEARGAAQAANQGVKETKGSYGEYAQDVQKMKQLLRQRAESTNKKTGELYREHIPKGALSPNSPSSDEIATGLGMSENEFMQKIIGELDIKKQSVPAAPKTVEVQRSQLPVGGGKEKASRLEARITESLDKTPEEIKDQLGSTYNQMSKKENIAKAVEYVTEKPNEALAVLRGEKDAPAGILKNSIYVAMENLAQGDVALARKLASLASTRAGQELSILTEINPQSPIKMMQDIVNVREAAFKRRYSNKSAGDVTKKVVSDIQSKVKKPDKHDWNTFIESIKC